MRNIVMLVSKDWQLHRLPALALPLAMLTALATALTAVIATPAGVLECIVVADGHGTRLARASKQWHCLPRLPCTCALFRARRAR